MSAASAVLSLPLEDVLDQGLEKIDVFADHAKNSVAPIAEQISDGAGFMAMVDNEVGVSCGTEIGCFTAGDADVPLGFSSDLILDEGDAVVLAERSVSIVVGTAPMPVSDGFVAGLPVSLSINRLLETVIDQTDPTIFAFGLGDDINLLQTAEAEASPEPFIDFGDAVIGVDGASAAPSGTPTGVSLDGDLSTRGAQRTMSSEIDLRQGVEVLSLSLGMPLDVSDGLSFDPPPVLVITRSDAGCFLAPTVTQAIGDLAIRVAA